MPKRNALLLQFLFIFLSTCAPLYPRTELPVETMGWQAQPRGRGTFQIMLSCAVTLGLCVWTSIHPDVVGGRTGIQRMGHKFWMAVQSLFVPEIIVSIAWEEWKSARALHRALVYEAWRKEVDARQQRARQRGEGVQAIEQPEEATEVRERTWESDVTDVTDVLVKPLVTWGTRVKDACVRALVRMGFWIDVDAFPKDVAFFVAMGGYVRKVEGSKPITVTTSEFFHAFKEGTIDTDARITARMLKTESGIDQNRKNVTIINIDDILDKGKASVLAKLIICGQVGWMVLQLIGRQASGLSMTLIELHTLIHILIAAIVYWLWWHKPLDVCEPILLDITFTGKMESEWSERPPRFKSEGVFRRFFDHVWLLPLPNIAAIPLPESELTPGAGDHCTELGALPEVDSAADQYDKSLEGTRNDIPVNGGKGDAVTAAAPVEKIEYLQNSDQSPDAEPLDTSQQPKPKPKKPFLHRTKNAPTRSEEKTLTEIVEKDFEGGEKTPAQCGEKTPPGEGAIAIEEKRIKTIIQENIFACSFYFIYAALHAFAWNAYFSTRVEQWMWRGACLVVGITPSIIFCFVLLFKSIRGLPHDPKKLADAKEYLDWIFYIIYVFASIGLFIEALVSLRRLPAEAYESVPWTAYIPHF